MRLVIFSISQSFAVHIPMFLCSLFWPITNMYVCSEPLFSTQNILPLHGRKLEETDTGNKVRYPKYYWDNKQQSQAQSDRCKISTDGVPISSNHPSIWNLVKQKWCKFRGLWLHSTNVVVVIRFNPLEKHVLEIL